MAKKVQICDDAGNIIAPGSKPANGGKPATVKPPMTYNKPQLITLQARSWMASFGG